MANGKTVSEAIQALEVERDGQSLNQFQVALRPKGRKKRNSANPTNLSNTVIGATAEAP